MHIELAHQIVISPARFACSYNNQQIFFFFFIILRAIPSPHRSHQELNSSEGDIRVSHSNGEGPGLREVVRKRLKRSIPSMGVHAKKKRAKKVEEKRTQPMIKKTTNTKGGHSPEQVKIKKEDWNPFTQISAHRKLPHSR